MIQHIFGPFLHRRILIGTIFLLCFYVTSYTNADCETPPTYLNAYLEWNFGSTVGSFVVYSCQDGYRMSGAADHIVFVCNPEEEWFGPEIDCSEKKSCSLPPSPAFGSYNVSEAGLVFQSSVAFQCEAGYRLDGPKSITCAASGDWKMEDDDEYNEPICKRSCTQELFRYQYHECYERKDSTGNWDTAKTSCENAGGQLATIKDSDRQSFVENILTGDSYFYWIGGYELERDWKYPSDGSYATYFNWAPDEPSTTSENCVYLSNVNGVEYSLMWNDEFCYKSVVNTSPQMKIYCICEIVGNCSTFSTPFDKYQYENRCLFFIDDSARDQPDSRMKCFDDFGGNLVEIKSQNMQEFIENVINDYNFEVANWWIGLEEGFERTWSWVDGERIETFFWAEREPSSVGEECLDILTNKDYRWNDDNCYRTDRKYICQYGEPKCGNPGIPSNGNMTSSKDSYSVGDEVYFTCNDGFIISDPLLERLTCQNDSAWSGKVPTCQKVNCSDPVPDVPHATSTLISFVYRGISVYECLDGFYLLKGYPVSVCQEDGSWSTPNMTCTEILTTQKFSTAPSSTTGGRMTTFTDRFDFSTQLISSTEDQTTEFAQTEIMGSTVTPSIQQTETFDITTQPRTTVHLSTTQDTNLLTLTTDIYQRETTNLGKSIASTQESLSSSTDIQIHTSTGRTDRSTSFVTDTSRDATTSSDKTLLTVTSDIYQRETTNLGKSIASTQESLTSSTDIQKHTSPGRIDRSTSFVTDTSRDATTASDSSVTTMSSPTSSNTDTFPSLDSFTNLLHSTGKLPTSVDLKTTDLRRTAAEISSTKNSRTTEFITKFSSQPSLHTNSFPMPNATMTPSKDSPHNETFGSSTTSPTQPKGQTSTTTNDFQSSTNSNFKTTHDSYPATSQHYPITHQRSSETSEETYDSTNGETSTSTMSSLSTTHVTDSSVSKVTDRTILVSKLLSTDHITSFPTEDSPEGLITSEVTSPNVPSDSSEPRSPNSLSQSYSKEPGTTRQSTNKGLIIGVSVTSAVIGVGLCIWLMLFVVFGKYPGLIKKRNKVHPTDSGSDLVKETNTENGQSKTTKEESLQEYTALQMSDISKDANPYLYKNNETIDYI